MEIFHLHMISDSTGDTVECVARASLVQFAAADLTEHVWTMVRHAHQVEEALASIEENPGMVMFTLVNKEIRAKLEAGCRRLQVPCVSVLDPVVAALRSHLGVPMEGEPGRQHVLNDDYFERIEAMQYAHNHDDGQATRNLDQADVVLVGVSRTSKTPTCMYLANRGIKAANVPLVPGVPVPDDLLALAKPLIVGLTLETSRLLAIRRSRLHMLNQTDETPYVDPDEVAKELREARRLFLRRGWPVIDVTRRSIEEVASTILRILKKRRAEEAHTP